MAKERKKGFLSRFNDHIRHEDHPIGRVVHLGAGDKYHFDLDSGRLYLELHAYKSSNHLILRETEDGRFTLEVLVGHSNICMKETVKEEKE